MATTGVPARRGVMYAGFAVFGAFWGAWGASIPAVRDQAGVSDGQLGTALLFVGAGALPAMLAAGRAVDRWGRRAGAALVGLFGGTGVFLVLVAHDQTGLVVGLTVVGAASGAADVAINTAAGSAEQALGGPVIARAHATFSTAVVCASLVTGALHAAGMPLVTAFVAVAVAGGLTAVGMLAGASEDHAAPPAGRAAPGRSSPGGLGGPTGVGLLAVFGGLAALGLAVENAHQSWSAVYLTDVLSADAGTAASGPAVFAAAVAITRFAASGFGRRHPARVVVGGAATAAVGTAVLAVAGNVPVGLAGLALAAAGTAVLFPTLLSALSSRVPGEVRGSATSIVTTTAYLGFLAGPVYVGTFAEAADLPTAMLAVAALAVGLAVLGLAAARLLSPVQTTTRRAASLR